MPRQSPDIHRNADTGTPNPRGDFLAAIGQQFARVSTELVEPAPPLLPRKNLPAGTHDPQAVFRPAPKLDTAAKLSRALRAARREWSPFLRNHTTPVPSTRVVRPIAAAEWRLEPATVWQRVRLPHYGGPIGRARAWYRASFPVTTSMRAHGAIFVRFCGVDYRAAVFVNGELAGVHEGFFAPFEFDITTLVHDGRNDLLIRVDNDAICMGNQTWGQPVDGDKLYAATGLGWDEPGLGWHHCPPGMGICQPVTIEARAPMHLRDLWVRTLAGADTVEVFAEVWNCTNQTWPVELSYDIHGRNFRAPNVATGSFGSLQPAGPGVSYYRVRVALRPARHWSPAAPWLYQLQVRCGADAGERQFGVRTFVMDTAHSPKGRLFLNGQPVRLRGANTMGHEQQCVYWRDLDRLRDDLLLVKLSHMNFLRFTQRPVEREVYEMCDRLGILTQTDLPLFGHLRRNQFSEAVRQAGEMERLVRGHACNVLVSFINEPFPVGWGDKTHRHLSRPELGRFFTAASSAVLLENPDRVIKPVDGDYDPPAPGLPDNHCYTGWYNEHGIEMGKLHKGFWQKVKPGWLYACGEFGSEGLEREELMRRAYPKSWLPKYPGDEEEWTPARIARAQTGSHYHVWFDRHHAVKDWIDASQRHQAWVTRLMTTRFRRDNRMVSFALHLFIDAFPAGWMKTVLDCERQPKAAFFAWREALTPLLADLRLDRWHWWGGERLLAEAWICNDRNDVPRGAQLRYQLEVDGRVHLAQRAPATVRPAEAVFQGFLRIPLPKVASRSRGLLRLALTGATGRVWHDTAVEFDLFPQPASRTFPGATVVGRQGGPAGVLAGELKLRSGTDLWLVDDPGQFNLRQREILAAVQGGATVLLLEMPAGDLEIGGSRLRFEKTGMGEWHFVSRATGHPLVAGLAPEDFRFWFDPAVDRPAPLLRTVFFAESCWSPILLSGQGGWGQEWRRALAAAERGIGAGRIIVCQVKLAGRTGTNPVARLFAERLCLHRKP